MIRLKLTRSQTARLEAAKPSDKAAFIMGYSQRHSWPKGDHWSLVVAFCDYPKAKPTRQELEHMVVGLLRDIEVLNLREEIPHYAMARDLLG